MVRTTTDELPTQGDRFEDTITGDERTVDTVEDDDRVVNYLITFEDGTAMTSDEFHDQIERGSLVEVDDKQIGPDDVAFDAYAIAAAWEAAEDVPVCVAVAITNEFTDHTVTAADGVKSDRDVMFGASAGDFDVHFEEKAVGVCDRDTARKYATHYVALPDRTDGKVLAVTPAQIFG